MYLSSDTTFTIKKKSQEMGNMRKESAVVSVLTLIPPGTHVLTSQEHILRESDSTLTNLHTALNGGDFVNHQH